MSVSCFTACFTGLCEVAKPAKTYPVAFEGVNVSRIRRTKATIVLHPELYALTSIYADEQGETMSTVIEAALVNYFRAKRRPVTASLSVRVDFEL